MSWETYQQISAARVAEGPDRALEMLVAARQKNPDFIPFYTMAGDILISSKRTREAEAVLLEGRKRDPGAYWINYQLAQLSRHDHDYDRAADYSRHAHVAAGWPQSMANGYFFTDDYFSANIPKWTDYFAELKGARGAAMLEIGSWQGGSATWLLDAVLTAPDAKLTCIDPFTGSSEHAHMLAQLPMTIEQIFRSNIAKTGNDGKVTVLKGYSQEVVRRIVDDRFDAIYIDGAHEAKFVIQDAVLCWPLLKRGGLMLFDDYDFSFADPAQNTARAIDFFLASFADELDVVDHGRQVLVRRTS